MKSKLRVQITVRLIVKMAAKTATCYISPTVPNLAGSQHRYLILTVGRSCN